MKTSEIFGGLLTNLKVDNGETIAARRDEIAKALNKEFRGLEGSTKNQLMVGSYGRFTAIRGISDLDMLYVLQSSLRDTYENEDGPTKVLSRVRDAIKVRYPQYEREGRPIGRGRAVPELQIRGAARLRER
jgi:tRNA nucleotidyltransferase (CCA-adding enzyme)